MSLRSHAGMVKSATATVLLLALAGAAFAAGSLPAGSVGTRQLKDNAVTSLKVDNGSLLRKDFKAGQLKPTTIKTFGPVKMNVGDPLKNVLRVQGITLRTECSRQLNGPSPSDDTIDAKVLLVANVDHVSYRSEQDYDEDLNPGEGANWYSYSSGVLVDGGADAPTMQTANALLPGGTGVYGRTSFMPNKGAFDCTFFGQLDLV